MDQTTEPKLLSAPRTAPAASAIYLAAFVTGAIVMSFEMLGSRYLNPYFGSGIYTWASLISTVLAALCVGYFIGGWLADRIPSATVLGVTVAIGSAYLVVLPFFAEGMLEALLSGIDDVQTGSLVASFVIMFFPVTFLGMYSPIAIRLMLHSPLRSGRVSGTVYGVSTLGSIIGTLGTTFYLIPLMGSRAITITLGLAGVLVGLFLIATARFGKRHSVALSLIATLVALAQPQPALTEELIDEAARKALMSRRDGQLDHIETAYNDIFIAKQRNTLSMSFQLKGWDFTQSTINLTNPDDLPIAYTRMMTVAAAYPRELKKVLMIGLGGGTLSTYLGRAMPDLEIDTVEIDPGVINAAKRYFGLRATERVRYIAQDGRVFLNRSKGSYDLILVDAFHGGYVPFHLLTKEFYALIKQRLAPGGAAAFNVHDGTKLYASTVLTLQAVFPSVDLFPSGEGEMITVVSDQAPRTTADLVQRAAALQEQHRFKVSLPHLVELRLADTKSQTAKGEVLTDDFAPADLYNALRDTRQKKK